MKKRGLISLTVSAFALAMLYFPGSSLAKGECKADVEKFCQNVPEGKGGVHHCLKQNRDLLSASCQAKLDRAKERRLACKSDKEKFCKEIQPGGGRIKACMKDHQGEISSQCRAYL